MRKGAQHPLTATDTIMENDIKVMGFSDSSRQTLSVVVITRNEEVNIRRCLENVLWADEIVILDSGSIDRTLEIAPQIHP